MSKFLSSIDWSEIYEDWMVLDNFRSHNVDNGLEQCPWCGQDFYEQTEPVMQEDGEGYEDYYDSDPSKRHYHIDCWKRRDLVKHSHEEMTLSDF